MSISPPSTTLSIASTAAIIVATIVTCTTVAVRVSRSVTNKPGQSERKASSTASAKEIRKKLPDSIFGWREPSEGVFQDDTHWESMRDLFSQQGYTLWDRDPDLRWNFSSPGGTDVAQNGCAYSTPLRDMNDPVAGVASIYEFEPQNFLCHAATARDGSFVIIRVLVVGEDGRKHLKILKQVGRGPQILLSHNHTLPLLDEFEFEDVVFGVFPLVACDVRRSYEFWTKNSVGDLVNMIMQMLQALVYIHARRIAHRNAFKENFLVQWFPESLKSESVPITIPRVYLHDFEYAVQFPVSCSIADRVLVGTPSSKEHRYARPSPLEVLSGEPYDPFKVDVWQLGMSLSELQTTIPAIDEVLVAMTEPDPSHCMTAAEVLEKLGTVVDSMLPAALLIPPVVVGEKGAFAAVMRAQIECNADVPKGGDL